MWTLTKRFRFEAAHHLPQHDGKCRRVHGHSWVGEVEVRGTRLQTTGAKIEMLIDYGDIGAVLTAFVDRVLDHHDLNETTGLPHPTSEALARYVFDELAPRLPGLSAVTIEETCTTRCRYEPARD